MLNDQRTSDDDFWCPLDESQDAAASAAAPDVSPTDRAALSRLSEGKTIPYAHVDRLEARGLVERTFGQVVLTRVGRTAAGGGRPGM